MNRLVPLLLAAILVVLLLMLWQLRPARVSPYVPIAIDGLQQEADPVPGLPEPVLGPAAGSDAGVLPTPPWAGTALPSEPAGGLAADAGETVPPGGGQGPERAAIRDRLLAAVESGAPDPAQVGGLIQELIDSGAGEQVGGIDLQVLRHNMEVAARIQEVATQMQQYSDGADLSAPATAARIQEYAEQLQQLQQQYRTDFTRAAGAGERAGSPP